MRASVYRVRAYEMRRTPFQRLFNRQANHRRCCSLSIATRARLFKGPPAARSSSEVSRSLILKPMNSLAHPDRQDFPSWARPRGSTHSTEDFRPHGSEPSCGAGRATSMASFWMKNPTEKDRLLLKTLTMSASFDVRITKSVLSTCSLTLIPCGRWSLVTN